jgi:hypothetical protein
MKYKDGGWRRKTLSTLSAWIGRVKARLGRPNLLPDVVRLTHASAADVHERER